jgi:hypothetical protein
MAQITTVTSEALQAKLRQLLPSQQGFGEDLQASNVILPVINLTETATGSTLRQDLQLALNFGGATDFSVVNTTTTVASTGGFYRIIGSIVAKAAATSFENAQIRINDGTSDKAIYRMQVPSENDNYYSAVPFDFVVFLRSSDTLDVFTSNGNVTCAGSVRQIADISGNLINPTGFTSQ